MKLKKHFFIASLFALGLLMTPISNAGFIIIPTSLDIGVSPTTPAADIISAGTELQTVSTYNFRSTGSDFLVTDLSLNVSQKDLLKENIGSNDVNLAEVYVQFNNSEGEVVLRAGGDVNNGLVSFSSLDFYVPEADEASLEVLVSMRDRFGIENFGGDLEINLALNDFEAVETASMKLVDVSFMDPDRDAFTDLNLNIDSWSLPTEELNIIPETVLSLELGEETALEIGASLLMNTALQLPVGTFVCVDDNRDNRCFEEDQYIVTNWEAGELSDLVNLKLTNNSGDRNYSAETPLLYALPGKNFLQETNPVYMQRTDIHAEVSPSFVTGGKTVSSLDEVFELRIHAGDEDYVVFREASFLNSDSSPITSPDLASEFSLNSEASWFVDGANSIDWNPTVRPSVNDCFYINELIMPEIAEENKHLSFWIRTDNRNIKMNEFKLIADSNSDCSDGISGSIQLNDGRSIISNGVRVNRNTKISPVYRSGKEMTWRYVTVDLENLGDDFSYLGIASTENLRRFDSGDSLVFDAFVLHNEMIRVDFRSDESLYLLANHEINAELKDGSDLIGKGITATHNESLASTLLFPYEDEIALSYGGFTDLKVVMSTADLIDDVTHEDDMLFIEVEAGEYKNGRIKRGGIWWSDDETTVYWLGDQESFSALTYY